MTEYAIDFFTKGFLFGGLLVAAWVTLAVIGINSTEGQDDE